MSSFEIRLVPTSPQSGEGVASPEYREYVTAGARGGEDAGSCGNSPYWLGLWGNYETYCLSLTRSNDVVADELARYAELHLLTFIADVPLSEDRLRHTAMVFERTPGLTRVGGPAF